MLKVNETIDAVCIWIQKKLDMDQRDTGHEVSEMVKALAELLSASTGYNEMIQMHVKDKSPLNTEQGIVCRTISSNESSAMHDFGLPPDDILYGDRKGNQ